jgi:hypothetical protein
MEQLTIEISLNTQQQIGKLIKMINMSPEEIVEKAVAHYFSHILLTEANVAYARLQANEMAWQDFSDEMKLWEATLSDGEIA